MLFFQKDFWFKVFLQKIFGFKFGCLLLIWIYSQIINNQRLAFERTQIDHHEDLTERGSESKYFGAWCIHISPSLSKIHIMGHPKRSKNLD